jgi:hypothetical protein
MQLGEELGHEGGALNRAAAALACGPETPRGRGCGRTNLNYTGSSTQVLSQGL